MHVKVFRKVNGDIHNFDETEMDDDFAKTSYYVVATVMTPKICVIGSNGPNYEDGLPVHRFKVLERKLIEKEHPSIELIVEHVDTVPYFLTK